MSDMLPSEGFPRNEIWGVSSGTGTLLTGAAISVEGSWTELKASTSFDTTYIVVTLDDPNGGNALFVDLAVGASGSEVAIATDLFYRTDTSSHLRSSGMAYSMPIRIPSGSRVSARLMGASASRTLRVAIQAFGGAGILPSYQGIESIGGTYSTASGSGSKGSWAQLLASTPREYKALHISWGTIEFNSGQSTVSLIDIGVGGSGSEIVLVPDLFSAASNVSGVCFNSYRMAFIPGRIPAGTRISFRSQVATSNGNRYVVVFVYGYY